MNFQKLFHFRADFGHLDGKMHANYLQRQQTAGLATAVGTLGPPLPQRLLDEKPLAVGSAWPQLRWASLRRALSGPRPLQSCATHWQADPAAAAGTLPSQGGEQQERSL